MSVPKLFEPLQLRGVVLRNRIMLSPLCQYSSDDRTGNPTEWHRVVLGARAAWGVGLVMAEATAVHPAGRISLSDTALFHAGQRDAWKPITAFIKSQGGVAGIQLAHAGRKAGTKPPWEGGVYSDAEYYDGDGRTLESGLYPVGASPLAFSPKMRVPREMTLADIAEVKASFVRSTRLAVEAGFEVVEIHAAHGYLLSSFLSPLTNQRTDRYGGSFENRTRLVIEVAEAVRAELPQHLPLFIRISATEYADEEGGWSVADSVKLAAALKPIVDVIDVSSGGNYRKAKISPVPGGLRQGYQAPFAREIRATTGVKVAAVGLITDPEYAEGLLDEGSCDIVALGRELMRNPAWALAAAEKLGHYPQLGHPRQHGWAVGGTRGRAGSGPARANL